MGLYKDLRITRIVSETSDTKTFILEPKTPDDFINYQAGQFFTLVFAAKHGEERRSFSISSSPLLNEPLSITVKRVDNGFFSRYLIDEAGEGDELKTIGASGFFTLPEDLSSYRQVFFFAAGSGITPVFSLIKTLLHSENELNIVLVYSNRNAQTTIFYKQLQEIQQQFPDRFKLEFLFSTAVNLARARLSKWLMEILLKEYQTAANDQTLCYLCGPFEYMRMASIGLTVHGITASNIKKEDFLPFKFETKELPPDTNAHLVSIKMKDQTRELRVQYPDTILKAAKKAGLQMPYSCEAGRCGTCVAICKIGKVWMSYNEVLMDEEIARGMILTCTGYPIDGDVSLYI